MNDMDKDLSMILKVLKTIEPHYQYEEVCKMDDESLKIYKQKLDELNELNKRNSTEKNIDNLRGKKLEELVTFLINNSGGIFQVIQNIRTSTNEIDQIIQLTTRGKFLNPINIIDNKMKLFICECKNYKRKVSVTYIGKFCNLLLMTDIKLGLFFSYHGVSGNTWNNSQGLVRKFYMFKENKEDKFCVIDFNYNDFESILNGNNILQIIEDKLMALQLDVSFDKYLSKHESVEKVKIGIDED